MNFMTHVYISRILVGLFVACDTNMLLFFVHTCLIHWYVDVLCQTMGGDFSSRGQQDCAKGIYALAGTELIVIGDTSLFAGTVMLY